MSFYVIVIILIVILVFIAMVVNAIQQQKEKKEFERRALLTKYRAIIEETEEVLMNAANLPISSNLMAVLHKRIHEALKAMSEINPNATEVKTRLVQSQDRIDSPDYIPPPSNEPIKMPDNDNQVIAIIQGIKRMRLLLRSEHSKGNVDSQIFINEDKRLDTIQMQINVESQRKRGIKAKNTNMLGSARQYFEKALATLDSQNYTDDYITNRKVDIKQHLNEITEQLKNANAKDAKVRQAEETDDLDILFAPKRKW